MGTIGYGAMCPVTAPAELVMIAESVTSLIVTAVATRPHLREVLAVGGARRLFHATR